MKTLKIEIYHSLDILQARIFSIDERNFLAFKNGISHGVKNFEKCDEALDCAVIQMRKDKIVWTLAANHRLRAFPLWRTKIPSGALTRFWRLGDLFEWAPAADLRVSCKKAGSLEEQQTAAPDRLLGATHAYVVGGHNAGAARETAPRTAEPCPRQADIQGRLMVRGLLILEGRPEGDREIRIYF